MSLQEQVSALKTEVATAGKKVAEAEAEMEKVGLLRAKVDLLETEKRRLESKIVDLRVEVASTEISHNDSGNVHLSILIMECFGDNCFNRFYDVVIAVEVSTFTLKE